MTTKPELKGYAYSALQGDEVRVIRLMPGSFDDDLKIQISHIPLPVRTMQPSQRLGLANLQETLPSGWKVYEALDGRYLFYRGALEQGAEFRSSWTHPDPAIDPTTYVREDESQNSSATLKYEALSYTWGTKKRKDNVFVADSKVPETRLSIGCNLESALRHLRYSSNERTLWVDAICIDQGNISEVNEQVKRMAEIYEQAERVIVWLGPEADNSKHALQTLGFLGKQIILTQDEWLFSSPEATETAWCLSSFVLPYDETTWMAIQALLLRSWYERVWVVQEIQLANSKAVLKCGHDEITWTSFRYGIVGLWQRNSISPILSRKRIVLAGRIASARDLTSPVTAILRRNDGRKCSNPRDQIYGLLGLFSSAFRAKIRPQYELPAGQVFRDFLLTHVNHTNSLELIRSHRVYGGRSDCPSWVPDLTSRLGPDFERAYFTGYSRASVQFQDPNILRVRGLRCTSIMTVSDPIPSDQTHSTNAMRAALETVRNLEPGDLHTGAYVTGESMLSAYATTLTAGYIKERFPESPAPTLDEWQRQDSDNALFGTRARQVLNADLALSRHEDFALSHLMGRTFIRSHDGLMGLAPAGTKKDDLVCVFLGLDIPMVIRKQQDDSFRVIGPCFVHGLEDANPLLGRLPKPWILQVFYDEYGFLSIHRFFNRDTGALSDDDPRLEPLQDWEKCTFNRSGDDPFLVQCYRNKVVGNVVKSDPRLEAEVLEGRGIKLETFALV